MRLALSGAVIGIACVMATWLAGCAPSCPAQRGGCRSDSLTSPDEVVCINEPQTGSHIVETRCFRRDDLDEPREADRAILERAMLNANRPRNVKRDP